MTVAFVCNIANQDPSGTKNRQEENKNFAQVYTFLDTFAKLQKKLLALSCVCVSVRARACVCMCVYVCACVSV